MVPLCKEGWGRDSLVFSTCVRRSFFLTKWPVTVLPISRPTWENLLLSKMLGCCLTPQVEFFSWSPHPGLLLLFGDKGTINISFQPSTSLECFLALCLGPPPSPFFLYCTCPFYPVYLILARLTTIRIAWQVQSAQYPKKVCPSDLHVSLKSWET